jgi:pimeloyl-ACP methyl ester carboxylesterase
LSTVVSSDGTPIAFDRSGEGPPIILIGDASQGRSDPKLVQLAGLLARDRTVLTYDRRDSGDRADGSPNALEGEIEDLDALIDAAGGSASVCGMFSGAVIALRAAAHGLEIETLALYEPPFMFDGALPTERIRFISVPTVVIVRERCDPRTRRAARALWAVLPDVQHRTLEGQSDDVDPEALAVMLERLPA